MAKQKSSPAAKPAPKKAANPQGQRPPTPAMPVRQHYQFAGGCC
jgi:hypothetical protein